MVASSEALSLTTRRVEHPSIAEGALGLGTFIDGNLLARQSVTRSSLPTYRALLRVPRRLSYLAYEKEDGSVEGQVAALIRPSEVQDLNPQRPSGDDQPEEEPWKASIPSWEPEEADRSSGTKPDGVDDEDHVALLPLGLVVRISQRRHHPDDLVAEAADVLRTLVREGAVEVVDQFLDTI